MSWGYLYVFLQSSLIETVIYWSFYRERLSLRAIFILVTAANAITHPIVFFGFMASTVLSYLAAIILAEAFAIAAETALHAYGGGGRIPSRRAACAAVAANLVSWQLAPMMTYWLFLRS